MKNQVNLHVASKVLLVVHCDMRYVKCSLKSPLKSSDAKRLSVIANHATLQMTIPDVD